MAVDVVNSQEIATSSIDQFFEGTHPEIDKKVQKVAEEVFSSFWDTENYLSILEDERVHYFSSDSFCDGVKHSNRVTMIVHVDGVGNLTFDVDRPQRVHFIEENNRVLRDKIQKLGIEHILVPRMRSIDLQLFDRKISILVHEHPSETDQMFFLCMKNYGLESEFQKSLAQRIQRFSFDSEGCRDMIKLLINSRVQEEGKKALFYYFYPSEDGQSIVYSNPQIKDEHSLKSQKEEAIVYLYLLHLVETVLMWSTNGDDKEILHGMISQIEREFSVSDHQGGTIEGFMDFLKQKAPHLYERIDRDLSESQKSA